jgi:ferredoxin
MSRRHRTMPDFEVWDGADALAEAHRPTIAITISVDRNHCHRYAICQQEAPGVFELTPDGRLVYDSAPAPEQLGAVRQAARVCPMQAINVREVHR